MFGTIMKELRNGSIPPHDHISHKCESQLLTGVLFGHQFMKHKAGFWLQHSRATCRRVWYKKVVQVHFYFKCIMGET